MATILIGSDICPIEGNQAYFERGDARSLLHDLLPEFEAADLVVANLECPFIDRPSPIKKTGPTFGVPSTCINGIREAGIDVLGLANNHTMDHGCAGLQYTMEVCSLAGIETVGAGKSLQAARGMLIKNVGGVRVAILAMAEHEFSIAGTNSWGANPLDLIEFVRTVKRERLNYDYLIVLLHGSHEFHCPTPRIQKTCRFMIEMGVNAVVVQHPHVLGGCEEYNGGHIVYGQGAFIMDEAIYRDRKSFHDGFLIKLFVEDDFTSSMELIPFVQSAPVPGARRMSQNEEAVFRAAQDQRSKVVGDPAAVESEWIKFCTERRAGYFSSLFGQGRVISRLRRYQMFDRLFFRTKRMLGTKNVVCCETHREAMETIFRMSDI